MASAHRSLPLAVSLGVLSATFTVLSVTSAAAGGPGLFDDTTQCVAGTFTVKHGVTQVHIHAVGSGGEDGVDVTQAFNGADVDYQGGAGGLGSSVDVIVPVTHGTTLYVGVGNSGMPGGAKSGDNRGGAGGNASWVTDADPRVNGECKPTQASAVVVAAGGGGGGGAGNKNAAQPGGAGGVEVNGGNGGDGASNDDDDGAGGLYSNGTSGGSGGAPGHQFGCNAGDAGGAGTAFKGGDGGDSGVATYGSIIDCSGPPPTCDICEDILEDAFGGGGGGGGGGYWGGGGGGGADDSGYGAGGGGASGRSFVRGVASPTVTSTRVPAIVTIEAVTTPPAVTSADHVTFTRGTSGSFQATASGVDTPYVRFLGHLPNGLTASSGTFADDGSGNGTAVLSGTPNEDGVFPLEVDACNSFACAPRQSFTLTVNGAPGITSQPNHTFVAGVPNSVLVTTSGHPGAAVTQTGKASWMTFTDNGNGTATLSGTPPSNAANQHTINLTATNGIGSPATQTMTVKVVTAIAITPSIVHLVPGSTNPSFAEYRRGFGQQLRATGTFPDGATGDVTGFVRWSSSNDAVATVTGGAFVDAHALGTATVTATSAAGSSATASVVVRIPDSITVTPATVDLMGGQTQQFTATGCYGSPCTPANTFDITGNVRWLSLNLDVRINDDGLATAQAGGAFATIFAEVFGAIPGGYMHGEADVHVTHGAVTSIEVSPPVVSVLTHTIVRYSATLIYQDGTRLPGLGVTWSTIDVTGTGVASIGPAGDAFSENAGTAKIRATFGSIHADATMNVIRVPSALVVSPVSGAAATPLVKGESRQYKAIATYADGAPDLDVTSGVTWGTTDATNLTMSPGGLVTAKTSQEGHVVTIFARYTFTNQAGTTSEISGNSFVEMTLMPPVTLAITPTAPDVLHPNANLQFTAIGTYADGTTADLTTRVNWDSSNAFVGVMNNSGSLHVPAGTTQGAVDVSAWVLRGGGVLRSNSVTVTVTDPLDHVRLRTGDPNGFTQSITAGDLTSAYGYFVEGFDVNENSLGDVTDQSTLTISPDGSCNDTHQCTATVADKNGSHHTITATTPAAVHPVTPGVLLTVNRANTQRIEITGGSSAIVAGTSTAPYHVTSFDRYGNTFDITNVTTFSVSPVETTSGCVSPSSTPTCHAATAGAHTVRAIYQINVFDVLLPLWVNPAPLDHITLSGGSTQVPSGTATAKYVVTGYDAFGNSGAVDNITGLLISPDGTCDNTARACTPASPGAHSVTAYTTQGVDKTSNALALTSVGPPTIAAAFAPASLVKGAQTDLTFTLTNPNSVALTGVGFTSTLSDTLVPTAFADNCANKVFSLPAGQLVVTSITLNAGASCTFRVRLLATAAGSFTSATNAVTSANGGSGGTASATVDVSGPPVLTKSFVGGSVPIGSTTPLRFTVRNPNTSLTLTGIGFLDNLPSGLSFVPGSLSGTCGGAAFTLTSGTLFVGPNGTAGAIGSGTNGATLAPGESCTFTADVVANTLGSKANVTSNVTSAERGTGLAATANVVVTPQVHHFDILMTTLTAGVPGTVTITARDINGVVMTDYAGTPSITGDFTSSTTGCGASGTDPCAPTYSLPAFVAGTGTATITAYRSEFNRSVTITDGSTVSPSSAGLGVNPGSFDHLTLNGGSAAISAGGFTDPYSAQGWDRYGNLRGNATFTLSISPDGSCGVDSCTATVTGPHTVTGTNNAAAHPTATRALAVGIGPIVSITLSGGAATVGAGTPVGPFVVTGEDLYGNDAGELPHADVTLTIDPDGTCDAVARTCTATKADAPGWYHQVMAEHVGGQHVFSDPIVVTAGPLDHLVLTPSDSTVAPEQFQSYLATGSDAYGNALGDRTSQATFSIDDGSCTDSSCSSPTAGDRTVTATIGTATGTATLHVLSGTLHHIAVTGDTTVAAGVLTAPFVVEGFDANGNSLGNVTSGATLSISEGSCTGARCSAHVADIGATTHVVTATHPGAIGGPSAQAFLVVTPGAVDHVTLTGGSTSIAVGGSTAAYHVHGYDAFGNDAGDVTGVSTLAITPDGTCDQTAHTCSATVEGPHTVTATHTPSGATATSPVTVTTGGGGGGGGGGGAGGLDHFGFVVPTMTAGGNAIVMVTAYDGSGAVKTDYSGAPTLTGDLGTSTRACGPVGLDPCPPKYFLGAFVNGVAKAFVTDFRAETGRTLTVTDGSVVSTSLPFDVAPGDADHIEVTGGSAFIQAGDSTDPYVVTAYDVFGNLVGDVTADSTLSLLPDGSCAGATCTATNAGYHLVSIETPSIPGALDYEDLTVGAGPIKSLTVTGDYEVMAGTPTVPYVVDAWDQWFNWVGDVTADTTLSLGPDGTCEDVTHTCRATAADVVGSTVHLVTATHPSATSTVGLFVNPGLPDHLGVTPSPATAAAGVGAAFTATAYDAYGNSLGDVTPDAVFTVVGGSCTGASCSATAAGDHTVSALAGGLAGASVLHVVPGPVDHITLGGGSASVDVGVATLPYTASGFDAYGNAIGAVPVTLSITPDGTCSQSLRTCTPAAAGTHTVTGTNGSATDTKSLSVTANVSADLRLTKTGPASAAPGADVTYQIGARNFGPSTAANVTVSDPFPAGTTYVSETHPSGWTCAVTTAYTCTRASLTVAAGAQAFTLVLHVGPSVTGPVSNTATVTSATSDPTPANNTPPAVVTQVGCARLVTGLYAGDLLLSGAGTTCLRNVTVTGKLTVQKGATLVAVNAVVGGAVSMTKPGAVTFCGSSLRSSVSIDGATGFVLVGDPAGGCASNTVTGSLSITGSAAGVRLRSNRMLSSVTVDNNRGGTVVAANVATGRLGCKGNVPAPVNDGQLNTASNKSGQCAGL